MKEAKLQGRYAQSLYILAKEENITEQVYKDILSIKKVCLEEREFQLLLKNAVVKPSMKKQILNAVFSHNSQTLTMKFLNFIVDKRRDIYLLGICEEFVEIYNKEHNIKKASLIVSKDISLETTQRMKEILSKDFNSDIDLETQTDESILGGFSLCIDGKLYDASYKKKLADLRKELLSN
ncbi:MAG: ATP synthase F1 subunit delta [Bacteroidota bacterium]|nr:ATP synthase F1 subunit delta [Bacteroidota bacterium]